MRNRTRDARLPRSQATPEPMRTGRLRNLRQVTSGEKTAGTETALRTFSPADIADMAATFGPGFGVDTLVAAGTSVGAGTAVDLTDLPQGYRTIAIHLSAVSSGGSAQLLVQISGDTGGSPTFLTSGYAGAAADNGGNGTGFSSAIAASFSQTLGVTLTGVVLLRNYASGNFPFADFACSTTAPLFAMAQGCYPTALDVNALRLTWSGGASFDAGTYGVFGIS